ncbi:dihydropteroate synthase [Catalinimonas alkaloidigena]|uniref:Dihydropteroate synthase n=1 Tax=Catalinimonas alkaloidigena TaxID=1075417 RepID=A0A1G9MUE7_9BACT|nr:dihydropteroate synthase [Catalinimonas alkaloidigena]SDL77912.1 dihydropteroate synthase [Catalinimonas alkaloidigena]
MDNLLFTPPRTLRIHDRLLDLSTPRVMGILNVTQDSFYDQSRYPTVTLALQKAEQMLQQGATFLDVGGYSSRPGADDIPVDEELRRVVPVIEALAQRFPEAVLSVDTFRAAVAERAVEAGAALVNDISGGELDPDMFATVGRLQMPYILMHMRGTPQTMTTLNQYEDLVQELVDFFQEKVYFLRKHLVKDIILDPGFGFAKNRTQNFALLAELDTLKMLELPLLVGLSRKSLIWRTLGIKPEEALNGTTVLHTLALQKGANILRVHDVKEAMEVIQLVNCLPH